MLDVIKTPYPLLKNGRIAQKDCITWTFSKAVCPTASALRYTVLLRPLVFGLLTHNISKVTFDEAKI